MGKVKGKHRLDKFYHLAKEHGYRSRASWKLVQLDSKYDFLRSSRSVLDLCAAPGGWMQVAVQRVPVGSLVLGIDLVHIAPLRGAVSIEQDITKPQCKDKVKDVMAQHGVKAFDLVLHDGSPNIGGAWAQESMAQNALVIDALKLATQFLAPKANFVTKVFRSQDYSAVRYCLNQLFERVEVDKPAASRSASAEIFVLGLKYKAPAKIDRRLLDVKHLFQESVESQPKVLDVLGTTKQKRHRDGYEDGVTILRKVSSAADFIWSETPLEVLGSVTSISFKDPSSLDIRDHALTTDEIKILCDDLRVLGKQDFKHLLKWRMHLRKSLSSSGKTVSTHATENEVKNEEDEEDEDDKVLNEMEELTNAIDRKKKREKKLLAKRRAKDKARKTTGMQIDALEDGYTDNDLFSLSAIKAKKDLVAVDSAEYDGDIGDLRDSDDENTHNAIQDHSSSDMDSDEERLKYDEQMEEFLDEAYERFVAKREGSTKQRKRAKQAHSENLLEDSKSEHMIHSDYDSDKDQVNNETNPLMVLLSDGKLPTQKEVADKWFGQNIFAEAVEDGDFEKDDNQDVLVQNEKLDKYESIREMSSDGDCDKYDSLDEMPIDEEGKHSISKTKANNSAVDNQYQLKASKESDDFEIVRAPVTDSSDDSSSSDESDVEVDTKAEILACAKKMLRKKTREQMLDDAYNKYMFHDEGLPAWFLEEEKRHRQPVKPITKEEITAMRAQFKEINARPAKKVAEAKDRKKRAAMRKLEKVRKKANAISEQADINDRSKGKLIEQLYKRATPKRAKKEYVVAKKGVSVKVGKGKVLVDPRLKKDMRSRGSGKPGKGGSKKGKVHQKGKGPSKAKGSSGGRKGKKTGVRE